MLTKTGIGRKITLAVDLSGVGLITLSDSLSDTEKHILGKQAETIIVRE